MKKNIIVFTNNPATSDRLVEGFRQVKVNCLVLPGAKLARVFQEFNVKDYCGVVLDASTCSGKQVIDFLNMLTNNKDNASEYPKIAVAIVYNNLPLVYGLGPASSPSSRRIGPGDKSFYEDDLKGMGVSLLNREPLYREDITYLGRKLSEYTTYMRRRAGTYRCECGAGFTSFPQAHLFWCPVFEP